MLMAKLVRLYPVTSMYIGLYISEACWKKKKSPGIETEHEDV